MQGIDGATVKGVRRESQRAALVHGGPGLQPVLESPWRRVGRVAVGSLADRLTMEHVEEEMLAVFPAAMLLEPRDDAGDGSELAKFKR